MVIIRGPCETVSTIVAPGSARPDGDVLITSPFGTSSLMTDGPVRTWKPAWCSVLVASAAESLTTAGTEVYRPEVSYQPPPTSATRSSAPASTYTTRLLNSHRCRNGSRPAPPRSYAPAAWAPTSPPPRSSPEKAEPNRPEPPAWPSAGSPYPG